MMLSTSTRTLAHSEAVRGLDLRAPSPCKGREAVKWSMSPLLKSEKLHRLVNLEPDSPESNVMRRTSPCDVHFR